MSRCASYVAYTVQRLNHRDPSFEQIGLVNKQLIDAEVAELADCLLANPDVVTHVYLGHNRLTDETGIKLARYVAASSTIQYLDLTYNQLGQATYLAMAAALQVNTSLRYLYLYGNQAEDESHIDAALVSALRLNRSRPAGSTWRLYSYSDKFQRLRVEAEKLGHPSLQLLLCAQLDHFTFQTAKYP